ncbi:hypothetical protein BDQ12DRAFT_694120 [Crucibulum laeve]|uniref:Short-chain dehydrogenase n=1 Tax=Crucibulum laeve TaxID=68775 RepID=A0A5C3LFR5_9AGAR|nr:hypothetical protein BDQ12DRAFT_694120 [Crucibulum laeve]
MGKKTALGIVFDQLQTVPPVATADLQGKTVVVIGANTGLGFEAAKHFARMNAGRVILACRSKEKGEAAVARLKEDTGYMKAELWIIDLSKFSSVKAFADRYEKEGGRLDILVENAATMPATDDNGDALLTEDGWETSFQVNNLALSLLAILLLPRMIQTAKAHSTNPRLVVVASEVHFFTTLQPAVVNSTNPLKTFGSKEYCTTSVLGSRYFDTKLMNVFFTRALSDRLGKSPVIVNCVNPGFCRSELRRDLFGVKLALVWAIEKLIARTTEQGSRQLVWAAVGGEEDLDKLRGEYISLQEVHEPSDYALGEEGKVLQERLWENLIGELFTVDPRVKSIVQQLTSSS